MLHTDLGISPPVELAHQTFHLQWHNKSPKRSKTPTVQTSSACFLSSFDQEIEKIETQNSGVRPTVCIKNPFLKYDDQNTKIATNSKSFVQIAPLQRCNTEIPFQMLQGKAKDLVNSNQK